MNFNRLVSNNDEKVFQKILQMLLHLGLPIHIIKLFCKIK